MRSRETNGRAAPRGTSCHQGEEHKPWESYAHKRLSTDGHVSAPFDQIRLLAVEVSVRRREFYTCFISFNHSKGTIIVIFVLRFESMN
jgi:hypothetical protein